MGCETTLELLLNIKLLTLNKLQNYICFNIYQEFIKLVQKKNKNINQKDLLL